jgi:hypothetical protein
MDDQSRSIIRNVKGPGMSQYARTARHMVEGLSIVRGEKICFKLTCASLRIVREDDILCLLESEREARRLR